MDRAVVKYYPDADVLVIELSSEPIADEELLDNDIVIGYNREGKIVRIEILDASRRGLLDAVKQLLVHRVDIARQVVKELNIAQLA